MTTNPLHEKLIEEFKKQFTCRYKKCCDGSTVPNVKTAKILAFIKTAFSQIEQATREELKEIIGKHNARILNQFQLQGTPEMPVIAYDERVCLIPAITLATEETFEAITKLTT